MVDNGKQNHQKNDQIIHDPAFFVWKIWWWKIIHDSWFYDFPYIGNVIILTDSNISEV